MGETERITVAETSRGVGASEPARKRVSLPVVDVLTGRGFITGKSGSGKSNSASVLAEKLLDNSFGLFIVDVDGEYYGLKEEYEILHAGGDAECDIQVTAEHAEKLAALALEDNVPIILDISSYLDESRAEGILTEVARHLFAKAKKEKQPFLLLIEEVHEYIPENGSVGECGKLLIKIGKRGRKHGLGVCGISQRPADVKKDFITQCDWLLWHRLTWKNDTKVVSRILDGEYASTVENLDDGEGFLMTDWASDVRRVQFYRKRTFDAGATPGLEDVERPDLKSVSDDLVDELEAISEQQETRQDRVAELEDELTSKTERIEELEAELEAARDVAEVAQQFVDALTEHVPTTHEPSGGRIERDRSHTDADASSSTTYESGSIEPTDTADQADESATTGVDALMGAVAATDSADHSEDDAEDESFGDAFAATFDVTNGSADSEPEEPKSAEQETQDEEPIPESDFSAGALLSDLKEAPDQPVVTRSGTNGHDGSIEDLSLGYAINLDPDDGNDPGSEDESEDPTSNTAAGVQSTLEDQNGEPPRTLQELREQLQSLSEPVRRMLAAYRDDGPARPVEVHDRLHADGNRTTAYARNRRLRKLGCIEHVGQGHYAYRLRELLAEECDSLSETQLESVAQDIEQTATVTA